MTFLINFLLLSLAIFIVSKAMSAIHIKNYGTAIVVALVYSIINFMIGWLLTLLALPLIFIIIRCADRSVERRFSERRCLPDTDRP